MKWGLASASAHFAYASVNGAEKLGHWGAGIVYHWRDYLRQ